MSNEKFSKVSNDNKINEQEKNISKVISNENSDKSEKNLNIPIKNISPEFNNEINNNQKIQKDKINSNYIKFILYLKFKNNILIILE